WTPDSRALLFVAEDRGRQSLGRLPIDPLASGALPVEVVAGGHVGGFAQSRDGGVVVFERSSTMYPPALFACGADGAGERAIESVNRALLARHALGKAREFTIKGWGGQPVQTWAIYPPNFDPKKKWPLFHAIHGGPHAAHLDTWH